MGFCENARSLLHFGVVAILLEALLAPAAHAGSTEPELAIADARPFVEAGVVTLRVRGNFDYDSVTRIGYPLAIVVEQDDKVAKMFLDGRVRVATAGGPLTDVPDAPGVVAVQTTEISVVLPPQIAVPGQGTTHLEATFDGDVLQSNKVRASW
jgi:hypothetical protein